ncbi:hypothetical protein ACS60E_03165 [Streptococcus suis]
MNFFVDPMIKFPEYPFLLPNITILSKDGFIFYGGLEGPFKLNGKLTDKIVNAVVPLLRQKTSLKDILDSTAVPNESVLKFLQILYSKSCLINYVNWESLTEEEKVLCLEMSRHKNFYTLDEYKRRISSINIFIDTDYEALRLKLTNYLLNLKINVIDSLHDIDNDTIFLSINSIRAIEKYYLTNEVLYFGIGDENIQVGPHFSSKTIQPKYYIPKQSDGSMNQNVSLNWCNFIAATAYNFLFYYSSSFPINGYFVVNNELEFEEYDAIPYFGNRNPIARYEDSCKFNATKYINKSNHLIHYRDSNINLIYNNNVSSFWKKLPQELVFKSNKIDDFIKSIIDFKPTSNKKYCPTGGSLNSTLLYIINFNDDELEGQGIYCYSNISRQYFQINTEISLSQVFKTRYQDFDYLVIPVSNISVIESKYRDFSFKVANLNLGVALSFILEKSKENNLDVEILFEFNEIELLNCFSSTNELETVDYIVGVKDERNN